MERQDLMQEETFGNETGNDDVLLMLFDRLVREGVSFSQCHVTGPSCGPSRASPSNECRPRAHTDRRCPGPCPGRVGGRDACRWDTVLPAAADRAHGAAASP